jgi:hypothetical protein
MKLVIVALSALILGSTVACGGTEDAGATDQAQHTGGQGGGGQQNNNNGNNGNNNNGNNNNNGFSGGNNFVTGGGHVVSDDESFLRSRIVDDLSRFGIFVSSDDFRVSGYLSIASDNCALMRQIVDDNGFSFHIEQDRSGYEASHHNSSSEFEFDDFSGFDSYQDLLVSGAFLSDLDHAISLGEHASQFVSEHSFEFNGCHL